ncbi:MAG TPA: IucA/IucC family protein [Actinospica sp.]|nr:IucA/IucC family protein [Actinospica sp.]
MTTAVQQPSPTPDAETLSAAARLAVESLLRCWVREHRVPRPAAADLVLEIGPGTVTVPVRYWSATGWHRFGQALSDEGPITPAELARLMGEATAEHEAAEDLAARAGESADRIAAHLADRAANPGFPDPETTGIQTTPFLAAEQALLAGHPLHPTPKSRDNLAETDYSPELRGGFQLDWFSVDESLIAEDSELGPTAHDLCTFLSGMLPDDGMLVPAHPWQAADLLRRPAVKRLVDDGKLRHCGKSGARWFATSSLRTVYRPDVPVMMKLSLGLNITNSKRENLRTELLRGIEAHRLFAGEAGSRLLAAHPNFRMLTDAGYLAVDGVPGLDVSLRHSPFRPIDYVYCVAALTDLGRGAISADGAANELAAHIKGLAAATGRPTRAVAADWFGRYMAHLIMPMLWMDAELGVTLEGHQQNTLIQLDEQGYPGAGWYRDNQGFYYRESRIEELAKLAGEPGLGKESSTIVPDDVVTERLVYYVGINNLFGVVGALGCAGLAEERDLLAVAREHLSELRGHRPSELLLTASTLRCKANLLTRASGLDELVGELATQSVYVEIPNPCAASGGS